MLTCPIKQVENAKTKFAQILNDLQVASMKKAEAKVHVEVVQEEEEIVEPKKTVRILLL
jgi:hypothetical protein